MASRETDHLAAELNKSASLLRIDDEYPDLREKFVVMSMKIGNGPAENPFPELKELTDGLKSAGQDEQVSALIKAIEDYRANEGSFW